MNNSRHSVARFEGAFYFALILLILAVGCTAALIFVVSFTTIAIATNTQPNQFFLAITNSVLDLIGVDRNKIGADSYLTSLGHINNALSIFFAFLIAAIPPIVGLAALLWKSRLVRQAEEDQFLLEHPAPTSEREVEIMESYYRDAELITVYAGDFSWLRERPVMLHRVRELGASQKIQLISSKDEMTVRQALGDDLFVELASLLQFNSPKDIKCSLITYAGGAKTFLYRYRDVENGVFNICAVRNLPKTSYLLSIIDILCSVPEPQRIAILICGQPGSGKTTAANSLRALNFRVVSASDVLRRLAQEKGLPTDRISLMNFWDDFLSKNDVDVFSQLLVEAAGRSDRVAFEGIRPFETVQFLRRRFNPCRIVYLAADARIRRQRLQAAKGEKDAVFEAIERSKMEQEVVLVEKIADLKLVTSRWSAENLEFQVRSAVTPLISM